MTGPAELGCVLSGSYITTSCSSRDHSSVWNDSSQAFSLPLLLKGAQVPWRGANLGAKWVQTTPSSLGPWPLGYPGSHAGSDSFQYTGSGLPMLSVLLLQPHELGVTATTSWGRSALAQWLHCLWQSGGARDATDFAQCPQALSNNVRARSCRLTAATELGYC